VTGPLASHSFPYRTGTSLHFRCVSHLSARNTWASVGAGTRQAPDATGGLPAWLSGYVAAAGLPASAAQFTQRPGALSGVGRAGLAVSVSGLVLAAVDATIGIEAYSRCIRLRMSGVST
jgi:hypothetical protein